MASLLKKIEIRDLGMRFGANQLVFSSLNSCFDSDGAWEIVSEQGLGKSLLLQIISGITAPTEGQLLYNDTDVFNAPFETSLELRLQVGYTFDLGGLLHNRTLAENLLLPIQYHKLHSIDQARARVSDLFEKFQIRKYHDLRPSFVSGSVRKMTVLLRALILRPRFLILDDPFVGLSEFQRKTFIDEIELLRGEVDFLSVVYTDSTHSNILKCRGRYILSKTGLFLEEVSKPEGIGA